MIKAKIYRNKEGDIFAFKFKDHDKGEVCAAVSVLVLNTANSIEFFTDEEIACEYMEEGGYISFELPRIRRGGRNDKAALLLDSMLLGLLGISMEHPGSIRIIFKEVST